MEMNKELYIKQLRPFLYLMDEAHEATGYIVVGDDKMAGSKMTDKSGFDISVAETFDGPGKIILQPGEELVLK
jgi:hypothetical protein